MSRPSGATPTLPVVVVTGFLGSGKTTLLAEALRHRALADTLVLVNELGEYALDHHFIRHVREDVVVLPSGCVCCAVREDLARVLMEQYTSAARGEIPPFARVLIETTGLADPTPVVATFVQDPLLARGYHLEGIVVTLDGVVGGRTLDEHAEARKQIALADRIVLTKVDLAEETEIARIASRARTLNPIAGIESGRPFERNIGAIFAPFAPLGAPSPVEDHAHVHPHGEDVASIAFASTRAVDYRKLAAWMSMMTQLNGERILRIKGVLHTTAYEVPIVVHSVQHVVHRSTTLPAWPTSARESRIVVITRGLSRDFRDRIRSSLADLFDGPEESGEEEDVGSGLESA